MKVIRISLSNLRIEEWFSLLSAFKNLLDFFGIDILNVAGFYALFIQLLEKVDKHLLILRKSVYTEELKEADKDRNKVFGSFCRVAKDSINLPAVAKKEAAKRLSNLLQQYKQYAMNGGYAEESSAIFNLLQDLDGKYAADVTLLGFGEWVTSLRQAEEKFLSIHSQRIQETIDKPVEPLPDIRKQIDQIYNSIVNVLEGKLLLDGLGGDVVVEPGDLDTAIWDDDDHTPPELRGNVVYNFVVRWNVILTEYRNLLNTRAGRLAKKKNPDTPSDVPPPEEPGSTDPVPDKL
ncbi:MAG: DUF6261 family protein [Tannerellaceae bacterium]|jgi:hypothetical protein|nr:DUF6261 family protein [Tannerellaceae bacterium]